MEVRYLMSAAKQKSLRIHLSALKLCMTFLLLVVRVLVTDLAVEIMNQQTSLSNLDHLHIEASAP